MANYRYLGYGITNEQGIAHLDHDANGNPIDHSYTGTGAGELDIIASLDDNTHISDSSIQSEIFEVIDATFKDIGTSTDYSAWTGGSFKTSDNTLQRNDEYTTLTASETAYHYYKSITDTDLCIEFDVNIKYIDGAFPIRFTKGIWTTIVSYSISSLGLVNEQWHHLKLVKQGTSVTAYVDGVNKGSTLYSDTIDTFLIILSENNAQVMKYKNFCIYPI